MAPVTQTPADSFARLIAGLCRAVAAGAARHRLAAPLLLLLWPRLHRLARRFASLAARIAAGTAAPRRPTAPRPAAQRSRSPYRRLPRRFAWLPGLLPGAAAAGSQLHHLLATEDMTALLAAAPQAGRLLRPLCRMLGVRPPPALAAPPPRPARPPVTPRRSAPRRPAAGRPAPTAPPAGPPRAARRPPPSACGPPVAA